MACRHLVEGLFDEALVFVRNLSRSFLAGLVTSSVQFVVELVKGDVVAGFVGGASFADGCCFGFCRRVEYVETRHSDLMSNSQRYREGTFGWWSPLTGHVVFVSEYVR